MILPILLSPDPMLRRVCDELQGDATRLVRDMFETLYDAAGRGLAAPQVAVPLRLFVMDCTWKEGLPDPRVFANPEVVERTGSQINQEGCLSLPDAPRRVERAERIILTFDGPQGTRRSEVFEGFAAACVQHEVDHLNGILILDHAQA